MIHKYILAALCLVLWPLIAVAQSPNVPVYQSGNMTPRHAPMFLDNGVIGDSGSAGGGSLGAGLSELNITNSGTPFCINDGPITSLGGYHQLCLGANALGGGLLSYQSYAGAPTQPLNCAINGSFGPCLGAQVSGLPELANAAILQSEPTTFAPIVALSGYYRQGDAPVVFYSNVSPGQTFPTPCTLNSGSGDGGSQFRGADGNCWWLIPPHGTIDIRNFGAQQGVSSFDSTTAIQNALNYSAASYSPGGGLCAYVPGGGAFYIVGTTSGGLSSFGQGLILKQNMCIIGGPVGGEGSTGQSVNASQIIVTTDVDGFSTPTSGIRENNVRIDYLTMRGHAPWATVNNPTACVHRATSTDWNAISLICADFVHGFYYDFALTGGAAQETWTNPSCTDQDGYPNVINGYPSDCLFSGNGSAGQIQNLNWIGGQIFAGQQLVRAQNFTGDGSTTSFQFVNNSTFLTWSARSIRPTVSTLSGPWRLGQEFTIADTTPGAPSSTIYGVQGVQVTTTPGTNALTIPAITPGLLPTSITCGQPGPWACVAPNGTPIEVSGYGIPPHSYLSSISGSCASGCTATFANPLGQTARVGGIFSIDFWELNIAGANGCGLNRGQPGIGGTATSNCGVDITVTFASAPPSGTTVSVLWDDPWAPTCIDLQKSSDNYIQADLSSCEIGVEEEPTSGGLNQFNISYVQIMGSPIDEWTTGSTFWLPVSSSSSVANTPGYFGPSSAANATVLNYPQADRFNPESPTPRNPLLCGDLNSLRCPWTTGFMFTGITNSPVYTADGWSCGGYGSGSNLSCSDGTGGTIRVQRTPGNTDTNPICVQQVLRSADSLPYASPTQASGRSSVLSVGVLSSGSNFSSADGTVALHIFYGTGIDEGTTAFFNGSWTNETRVLRINQNAVTAQNRTAYAFLLPSTESEIAFQACYTPTGTAGANDYFQIGQVQIDSGWIATPFDFHSLALEQDKSRLEYQQSYPNHTPPGTVTVQQEEEFLAQTGLTSFHPGGNLHLPVTLNGTCPNTSPTTIPTNQFYGADGSAGNGTLSGGGGDVPLLWSGVSTNGAFWQTTNPINMNVGQQLYFQWTADCRL